MMSIFFSLILFLVALLLTLGFGLLITGLINKHLTLMERWVVGVVVGSVVWMLLIYLTAWFHIRSLSLIVCLVASMIGWKRFGRGLFQKVKLFDWLLLLLIIVGVVGQLFLVAPSGLTFSDGMRFYGVNSHDGMWHVTLMQSLSTTFPPELPTYAGIPLKGYHYLIDLWGSELVRVFSIPAVDLTFRWLPLLFSTLTGYGVFALLRRLTKSKSAQYLGVFLTYFAGSFGHVLTLLGHEGHASETAFWAQQSISTFINLPLGTSLALIITAFLLLTIYFHSIQDVRLLWLASLVVGASISIKAYGGVLMMGAFCVTLVLYGIIKRKIEIIGPLLLSIGLTGVLILPQFQAGSQSFIYEPGWFLKTMMETPDHVNYPLWELQRQTYVYHNSIFRVAEYWIIAFLIFLAGNMGVRIIGFLSLIKQFCIKKRFSVVTIIMIVIVAGGIIIPMLFLQAGVVWNSIQFMYYSLFVMNLFTAITIDQIKHRILRRVIVFLLVLLTIPTTIATLKGYYQLYTHNDSYFLIPHEELAALSFIKSLPNQAKLLTAYSYESYVPALTGKTVYYVDETQAMILLLPTDRRSLVTRIFCHTPDAEEVKALMEKNQLKYLYTTQSKNVDCHPNFDNNPYLTKVFSNHLSTVYRLD